MTVMTRHIRKDDKVKILAGKDREKTGKVLAVSAKTGRITVEGRNIITRHERPKKQGQKGQKIQVPMPLHPSNVMLICPHCDKPTRVGYLKDEKGVKSRVCKQCKKRI